MDDSDSIEIPKTDTASWVNLIPQANDNTMYTIKQIHLPQVCFYFFYCFLVLTHPKLGYLICNILTLKLVSRTIFDFVSQHCVWRERVWRSTDNQMLRIIRDFFKVYSVFNNSYSLCSRKRQLQHNQHHRMLPLAEMKKWW